MALSPDLSPMLMPGVKLESLPLTPLEGFVLSRVNGLTPVREIVAATGLPADQVEAALVKLESLGAIGWQKAAAATPRSRSLSLGQGEIKATGPDLEIILERIALLHRALGRRDHYQLLGIPRTASADDVKSAYAALSREIHPDRFYKMELGKRRDMLDTVFARVSEAYETLRDPAKRAEYDRSLAPARAQAGKPQAAKPVGVAADASRIAALAEQEIRNGNYAGAIQNYKIAVAMAPGDAEIARRAAFVEGLQSMMSAVDKLNGDPAGAVVLSEKVIAPLLVRIEAEKDQFPVDEKLLGSLVTFILNFDHEYHVARELAEKLIRRAPRAGYHVLLGRVLEKEQRPHDALKQYEKALQLDANHVEAKEAIRNLKKK